LTARDHSLYALNPSLCRQGSAGGLFSLEELNAVVHWFQNLDWYSPTPLRTLPVLAREIGVGELLVKDESSRMGLDAFKILGVSYAVEQLIKTGSLRAGTTLTCATDGNHGRALAHIARRRGLHSRIFIHKGASRARVKALEAEGAHVVIVDGSYDDSVRKAAREAERNGWILVSDTAWPGYEAVPRYIMAGYTMLMAEVARQWASPSDLVLLQAGVGGFAGAVVSWFLEMFGAVRPRIVSCEPENAACVLESIRAGRPVVVNGSLETIMAGLSCGTVSSLAWTALRLGLDACVAVSDDGCADAVRKLSHPRANDPFIIAGESGACGVAALTAIMQCQGFRVLRESLQLHAESRVLVINTEGATDPEAFHALTGIRPDGSAKRA
jgi:diaminopropionate ammonia-lyase